MIPKILHHIWIGDESKRPNRCIESWKANHPGWDILLWGNETRDKPWTNRKHMDSTLHLCGKADLMRYEILHMFGGIAVDADSMCRRTTPDWILECEAVACWENELMRPGLIATGFLGCEPGNKFFQSIVDDLHDRWTVLDDKPWKVTGPGRITHSWNKHLYRNLTILPSHFFIPNHFDAPPYTGTGPVYADQLWGTTFDSYGKGDLA